MNHKLEEQPPRVAFGLFLFTFVVFVLVPLILMLWCHFEPLQVLQHGDAGSFRAAASSGDLTNVTTSAGVVTVEGGFSALQDQALFVRATNKYGLELCTAVTPEHCTTISGTWVGPMHPVPHNTHWYVLNFSGIRTSLPPILFMGLITAFFGGFAALAEYARDHKDDGTRSTGHTRAG
jgi:hypothetical protein